jgi:hypothetical protein
MMNHNVRGKGFLVRLIMARVTGQSPEDFAEQELKLMTCDWCADGWPVTDGQHHILGVVVPCDAALQPKRLGQEQEGE